VLAIAGAHYSLSNGDLMVEGIFSVNLHLPFDNQPPGGDHD
jgi:hypothetical protein